MRRWDLPSDSPIVFTLASDPRFSEPDHTNDHIWKLRIGGGDPSAISVTTTYGLRAQLMRVFPRFTIEGQTFSDPNTFHQKPKIKHFLPNYFQIAFMPISDLEVISEYWVPDSQSVCGRFEILNKSNKVITVRVEIISILKPLDEGENMDIQPMGSSYILRGKTHDIFPVLALSGVSQASQSPYTALIQDIQIVPGKLKPLKWVMTTLSDADQAVQKAKMLLNSAWEAEIAKVILGNQAQNIEIFTGENEWDVIFAAAQNMAISLALGKEYPMPGFVTCREPDLGYSYLAQGTDHNPVWNKSSAFDAYYLMGLLMPGNSRLVKSLIENLLDKYANGLTPKPSTQITFTRTDLDQPLICTMVWEYFKYSQDNEWLNQEYPKLVNFLRLWFDPSHDKDHDGLPEWENLMQSGLEESPQFNRWIPETQGLSIQSVECMSLGALLYKECKNLLNISKVLDREENLLWLFNQMEQLEEAINLSWSEKEAAFLNRDFESHISQVGKLIFENTGDGTHQINKSFRKPHRLLLHISGDDDTRRKFNIMIDGKFGKENIIEEINYYDLSWIQGNAFFTFIKLFSKINSIVVKGLNDNDHYEIRIADHSQQDISQLLPLWAGLGGQHKISKMIERTISNAYWGPYGLPICPPKQSEKYLANPAKVRILWNNMIGEGLINHQEQELAAKLVTNIMKALTINLKKYHGFREFHHSQSAEPSGENNHLRGLAPIKLFLSSLGVQYINSDRIIIVGNNPYPWPVTVKYKGTIITRHHTDTVVTFLSGEKITVDGSGPHEINLIQENQSLS